MTIIKKIPLIIKTLILLISFSKVALAEEVKNKVLTHLSEGASKYISNLIPGEGHTEFSIDFRENHSPNYSILAVREISPMEDGNLFTQFSLFNTEQSGEDRIVGNLGFGKRKLIKNNTLMIGLNNFYDYEVESENTRTSLGLEIRSAVIEGIVNRYVGLTDRSEERVLDGWDYKLSSQIPYLHWADFYINGYEWRST